MEDVKTIRKLVCRHHGGLEEATDDQILIVWRSLDESDRQRYQAEAEREVQNQ